MFSVVPNLNEEVSITPIWIEAVGIYPNVYNWPKYDWNFCNLPRCIHLYPNLNESVLQPHCCVARSQQSDSRTDDPPRNSKNRVFPSRPG